MRTDEIHPECVYPEHLPVKMRQVCDNLLLSWFSLPGLVTYLVGTAVIQRGPEFMA